MKKLSKKLLFGTVMLLASNLVFAVQHCPPVVGYTAGDPTVVDRETYCTYTSNQNVGLVLPPKKARCPRFMLTDPHYYLMECHAALIRSAGAMRPACVCKTHQL